MKKVCLLISHECADAEALFEILGANPRIQCQRLYRTYDHPLVLEQLISVPHKLHNAAALWMDMLFRNHEFSSKALYDVCKFIYMIRPAEPTINGLIARGYEPSAAARYYAYRLRRICEMARKTPGAVVVTYNDAVTGNIFPLIEEYLGLKQSLLTYPAGFFDQYPKVANWEIVESCQSAYERYLYFLRSQQLRFYR